VRKQIAQWEKANQIYYGPDRDTKNFPHPKFEERTPATRLGFLPSSWFDAMYEKTGVTGPYVLGFGAILTLLSKEIWVVEHQMIDFTFWAVIAYTSIKFGKRIGGFFDKMGQDHLNDKLLYPIKEAKEHCQKAIEEGDKVIWSAEGQKYLFDAKKENVGLQLEAEYRERLDQVYQDVKKRLNYQLDMQNCKRSFEQAHMVNWVVDSVVKNITPQQEKDSISKCLADLKALSATA